jgi:hypothetical protein
MDAHRVADGAGMGDDRDAAVAIGVHPHLMLMGKGGGGGNRVEGSRVHVACLQEHDDRAVAVCQRLAECRYPRPHDPPIVFLRATGLIACRLVGTGER